MNKRMKKGFGIPSDLEKIMLVGKIGYYICLDLPLKTCIILENLLRTEVAFIRHLYA